MDVLLTYDSGFPTRLRNHTTLAHMLRDWGEPFLIRRLGSGYMLEWWPITPGSKVPSPYQLPDPWPRETPRRSIVRISLTN